MTTNKVLQGTAEMSHGKTRYFEAGEGPPLLLIHGAGFLAGAHRWLPVMPSFAEHFHVYSVDCLGYGPGDRLEQPYSFGYLVDHLREFQDVMGLRKTHVIGHSMGGWLGVLFAYESPNRVDRFINVAGGGVATRPLASMMNWKPPTDDAIREVMVQCSGTNIDTEPLADELIALAHDPGVGVAFKSQMDHMSDPETRLRYNTKRRLPLLQPEMLVMWGTEDKTNAFELGVETHELAPGSEFMVFEGIGHGIPREAKDQFVAGSIKFLSGT